MKKLFIVVVLVLGTMLQAQAQCQVETHLISTGSIHQATPETLWEHINLRGSNSGFEIYSVAITGLKAEVNQATKVKLELTAFYSDGITQPVNPREVSFYFADSRSRTYKADDLNADKQYAGSSTAYRNTFIYDLDYDQIEMLLLNPVNKVILRDNRTGKTKTISLSYNKLISEQVSCVIKSLERGY